MTFARQTNWTAAYDNRGAVPTHEAYFSDWGRKATAFRQSHPPEEIPYGEGDRERLDLFRPSAAPRGLFVFFHGGWWMNFDRSYFSHLAAGALARGWAVAVPSYTLAPEARITQIVAESVRAVCVAAKAVPEGELVIGGHSAGGHLAAMIGTEAGDLPSSLRARIARLVPISAVSDLRPVLRIAQNEVLNINAAEALAMSPALLLPCGGFDLTAWVGADELPEFVRQNAMLGTMWGGHVTARIVEVPGKHHFDVIDALAEPESELTRIATLATGLGT